MIKQNDKSPHASGAKKKGWSERLINDCIIHGPGKHSIRPKTFAAQLNCNKSGTYGSTRIVYVRNTRQHNPSTLRDGTKHNAKSLEWFSFARTVRVLFFPLGSHHMLFCGHTDTSAAVVGKSAYVIELNHCTGNIIVCVTEMNTKRPYKQ